MVVLILSSSRGGSTIFTEFLRRHPGLRHLPGEINPLLRLSGLGFPASGSGSDALDVSHFSQAEPLKAAIEAQAGGYGPVTQTQMVADVCERLTWQWPQWPVSRSQVERAVADAWEFTGDAERFTQEILRNLGPEIHPGLYDLPRNDEPPPPHPTILEEPPFILFSPWRRHAKGPLIIKTPSNAYRLPFYRRFFADTPLKILHLTRNPAAAINGLIDGWLFPGFHTHFLPTLQIRGYSERVPGGDHWWKFDLPPGWEPFGQGHDLAEVCAFQWCAAHRAILEQKTAQDSVLPVRFEDFLRSPLLTMERVCDWLQVPFDPEFQAVLQRGLAPRMATARPRQRRWFDRHQELEPVLALPEVRELASALGYENREQWL